ncbi:acetyl-CoA synthetase [Planoprotostelium fungivorum]|uniref:Acetyl-coenzyme A synthetase n=1 Tax=Planoprotostelium fungivorum TaxID=1890364 RepID=A0A2P6NZL9_9EUKA|nr:acetyl-CoA synthetase [Planoprotostelium fungivorum]
MVSVTDLQKEHPLFNERHEVPDRVSKGSHISSMAQYEKYYRESIENPESFWQQRANELLTWTKPFTKVFSGGFENGDVKWFEDGELNVSYNCLDRHAERTPDKVAIIWEGDSPNQVEHITYKQALEQTCRLANAMKELGVKRGESVCIYLPNCPTAAYAMLACARIGAPHSVVFAGFSADSLADRIRDSKSKLIITADQSTRGGKVIPLKQAVDDAVKKSDSVQHVLLLQNTGGKVHFEKGRDVWLHEAMEKQSTTCQPESMNAEDPLFYLYTSGSTGTPKGLVHTQGGYLLYAALTHLWVFDYRENDIYACVADVGWITGHSYIVYGPLCNGATTFMFEGLPTLPDAGRYWDMVQRHKITQFYTAPTAIRTLMKFDDTFVKRYDVTSLRVLGSVGEPINPESYNEVVGDKKCSIVDTYWQTESGGHLLTPLPGATPQKAGSASFAFFGIVPEGNSVSGVLCISKPWPGITRTIFNDHERYMKTYLNVYKNKYFTGDGVWKDQDGYHWITGRVDDVINVSGHRIGTSEVEGALVTHNKCAEAACVGVPHDVKGQAIFAYVILKENVEETPELLAELKGAVRTHIGPFATPDFVVIAPGLPKTRSGKIMRRLLRKIAAGELDQLGDTSTLADPHVLDLIIEKVKSLKH